MEKSAEIASVFQFACPLKARHASSRRAGDGAAGELLPRAAEAFEAEGPPLRGGAAAGDDGGVAGGDADAEAAGGLVLADPFGQAEADAETLIVRQRDEAADPFASAVAEGGEGGTEGDGAAVPEGDVTGGGSRQAAAQIMMSGKQRPEALPAAADLQANGPSPKGPSGQVAGRHVQMPVGGEPLQHVVVAGDRDEAWRGWGLGAGGSGRAEEFI